MLIVFDVRTAAERVPKSRCSAASAPHSLPRPLFIVLCSVSNPPTEHYVVKTH